MAQPPPRLKVTETSDPAGRDQIMGQILAYNEEDLDATWAVLSWLLAKSAPLSA